MSFLEYYTEIEKWSDCLDTEWWLSVWLIYPNDHVMDRVVPRITGELSQCLPLAQEKIKNQNSNKGFYQLCATFTPSQSKILSQTVISWRPSVVKDSRDENKGQN